jgi:hypothetical protein
MTAASVAEREQLSDLRDHWADAYDITIIGGRYQATARFGSADTLTAATADGLRRMIWAHYPRRPTERCSL